MLLTLNLIWIMIYPTMFLITWLVCFPCPDKSGLHNISRDLKWYFFCPREKKYASGARQNRTADCGYWKTTGRDRPVKCNSRVVGKIKTLIFHIGRAPEGDRTDWVMHEYRLEDKKLEDKGVVQVILKLYGWCILACSMMKITNNTCFTEITVLISVDKYGIDIALVTFLRLNFMCSTSR